MAHAYVIGRLGPYESEQPIVKVLVVRGTLSFAPLAVWV